MAAFGAFVKHGHWLVGAPDLDLLEVSAIVRALVAIFANDFCLVYVFPSVIPSEHIVYFFTLEMHLILELTLHPEYVRAGLAEKSEVRKGSFCQKNVGAGGAEKHKYKFFILRFKVNFKATLGFQ